MHEIPLQDAFMLAGQFIGIPLIQTHSVKVMVEV